MCYGQGRSFDLNIGGVDVWTVLVESWVMLTHKVYVFVCLLI